MSSTLKAESGDVQKRGMLFALQCFLISCYKYMLFDLLFFKDADGNIYAVFKKKGVGLCKQFTF